LFSAAHFALGAEQLTLKCFELFLEQITFDLRHPKRTAQRIALGDEGEDFVGGD